MAYIGRQQDGFGVRSRFIFTATGGQTTFTTDDSSNALSYSDGAYVDVYLNGVLLDPSDYTATSLTSIVLDSGASADDVLEVIVYDIFSVFSGTFTNGITASEATITNGISAGSATVTGDLTVDTDTLYVDSTNNRVGVGTVSPAVPLHVKVGTDENFFMSSDSGVRIQAINDAASAINTMKIGGDPLIFLGTGGTERMRIQSDGDVLIGKSSSSFGTDGIEASAALDSNGWALWATGSPTSSGGVTAFNRTGSDGLISGFYKDGTTVGYIKSVSGLVSRIVLDPRTSSLEGAGLGAGSFDATSALIIPTDGAGNNSDGALDLGSDSARFRNLKLSGGVYLGGTASTNLLDDYEEGTWTPTWNGGGTVTVYTANYMKIGELVHVEVDIQLPSSSSTSTLQITGLPYNGRSSYNSLFTFSYNSKSSSHVPSIVSNSTIRVRSTQNGGPITCSAASSGRLIFAGQYQQQ